MIMKKKTDTPRKIGRRMKITLTLTLCGMCIILLGTLFRHMFSKPRPKSENAADIVKFAASADFNRLSTTERQTYLKKLRPGNGERPHTAQMPNLSEQERNTFRNNVMRLVEQERNKQLKQYFSLKTQEEKNAFLDQEIARMEKFRTEWEQRRRQRGTASDSRRNNADAGQRRRPSEAEMANRMRQRMETASPESRAMRNQYMRELLARARATGKQFPAPGRPPRS